MQNFNDPVQRERFKFVVE